jgi:hypothetical protein
MLKPIIISSAATGLQAPDELTALAEARVS